jgi:hypothetical protein
MPPKKHSITQEKAQKVVEDKTFGLKNKKGPLYVIIFIYKLRIVN